MKTKMKKIGALIISFMMLMAMGATVMADTTLEDNGEQGAFTSPDTPVSQDKTLVLNKELKAYNVDAETVKAPTIQYKYTIKAATVPTGATVTDKEGNPTHEDGVQITVPVKAGVGQPTIANSGIVAWSNSDELSTNTNGLANYKDISIDFSNVVFQGAGVYRYEIDEELVDGYTYPTSGVTETSDKTNGHTRYIDVYVRPSTAETASSTLIPYVNGSDAKEWDIYGFTCFYNNSDEITEDNKTTSPVKTTGFVAGTDGTTTVDPDRYYTFNLTLKKIVENDGYGAANIAFPFTVIFTNSTIDKSIDVIGSVISNTVTEWTDPDPSAMTDGTNNDLIKGVVKIKNGGEIKYIGIPNGTSVEVYETNVATGVTYKVTSKLYTTASSSTTTTDESVVSGTAPNSAVAQAATKADKESTKVTFTTTADADNDNTYKVEITNKLLIISPTGVIVRYAPYALLLGAGAMLFILSRRWKKKEEA